MAGSSADASFPPPMLKKIFCKAKEEETLLTKLKLKAIVNISMIIIEAKENSESKAKIIKIILPSFP